MTMSDLGEIFDVGPGRLSDCFGTVPALGVEKCFGIHSAMHDSNLLLFVNSKLLIRDPSNLLSNARMDIKEIRRHNLQLLSSEFNTMEEFAAACGYEDGNYCRQLATGHRKMGDKTARKIEAARNRPVGWMDQLHDDRTTLLVRRDATVYDVSDGPEMLPARLTPIVGEVMGGPDGFLDEYLYPPGEGDGFLLHSTRDKSSYTVKVRGDSMRPRIKPGEYLAVDPSVEAQPGDDVVVIFHDGRKMVKELVFIRADEIEFHSINDGSRMTIKSSEIRAIHRVGGIYPRGSAIQR
jgi:phage repressor protein C with HTH and peptisase S24 domain